MARFTDEVLNEIKSRVRLSDLIGRTVALKKRGKDHVGLSPFSNEKTPSFYVHDDRGFYKCFSTQKSGDCFTWLMEAQRMSFTEAVQHLAAEHGIELTAPSPEQAAASAQRARILQCLAWAQNYFRSQLAVMNTREAKAAREYLAGRGLHSRDSVDHGIGYAPADRIAMLNAAHESGWGVGDLDAAGLVRQGDDKRYRAFFRHRITLPVHDMQGHVIGFTARAMAADQQPKYLNSPETSLFVKGAALFGLHAARSQLLKGGDLFVVEGCFDQVIMMRAGLAACAPLGTALTPLQLELLWRLVESPVLCFDGDDAGLRAARRSAERGLAVLRGGRALRFITLPPGEDPDTLLRGGGELPAPVSHFAVIWDMLCDGLNTSDPNDRGRLRNRIRILLETIGDKHVRVEWSGAFRVKFQEAQHVAPPKPSAEPAREQRQAVTREARAERKPRLAEPEATAAVLLLALLDDPVRVDAHLETLAALPCGQFSPLRDFLAAQDQEQVHLAEPWARELVATLRAQGAQPGRYSPEGWERAARGLVARYSPA